MIRKLILSLLVLMTLVGCSSAPQVKNEKIKIVTTIYPVYNWVQNLVSDSDNIEVEYLLDKGVDLHSFQPSSEDIMDISTSDLFIHVGGESDEWVEDVLNQAVNKNMKVINLMEVLKDRVKEEEIIEGMEDNHHHDHEHEEEHDHKEDEHEHEHEHEYDEHVWLSLKNAKICCEEITKIISSLDSKNADLYKNNLNGYLAKLDELDEQYEQTIKSASFDTIIVADRFPFRYLVDDYGLKYYAAFVGCSAETEASFDTIVFLANKLDELGLKDIVHLESSDGSIAKTVRDTSKTKDAEIRILNSLQSKPVSNEDYLDVMKYNLEVIKEILH